MTYVDVSAHQNYDNISYIGPLSKRQKRKVQKNRQKQKGLNLEDIEPITVSQQKVFNSYLSGKNLLLHGVAGTGKTFVTLYLALRDVLEEYDEKTSVHLIRSVVPTRDMGFLPGNQREKSKAYESPYYAICNEMFGRGDAYDILKTKGVLQFNTTSFIRGLTLNDSIVIVDECQNMTWHELDSVITRLGDNSRVVFCGDFRQSDFKWDDEKEGIHQFMRVIKRMKSFDFIEFDKNDIVRSDLVKEYILSKLDLDIT
jgi:phosphate starvation-inducible protein PhoH